MFKYAMNFVAIDMNQLFELRGNASKIEHIQSQMQEMISTKTQDGYLNYYPFNHEWFEC